MELELKYRFWNFNFFSFKNFVASLSNFQIFSNKKWKLGSPLKTQIFGRPWTLCHSQHRFPGSISPPTSVRLYVDCSKNYDKLCSLRVDDFTTLQSECKVFKNVIVRKFEKCTNVDVGEINVLMSENYAEAAPVLTSMYKLSITCGYASARVECLFTAMSYVDAPRRQRSKSERKCALTHLYFEREMVKNITFAEFSEEWLKKPQSLFF